MRFFVVFLIRFCLVLLILTFSSSAGIVDNIEEVEKAFQMAESRKKDVLPGTILALSEDSKIILSLSSAVVLTPSLDHTSSQSVLGCAHSFHESRAKDPKCTFSFFDHTGEKTLIDTVIPRSNNPTLDPTADIAVYHLSKPTVCNPQNVIAKEFREAETLSSLSNGWVFTSRAPYAIFNTDKSIRPAPYYYTNTFSFRESTYYKEFSSTSILKYSSNFGQNFCYYLPDLSKDRTSSSLFINDSGSGWFTENGDNAYSFSGISSLVNIPGSDEIMVAEESNLVDSLDFTWILNDVNFKVYVLPEPRILYNKITPLAPHRDWILLNCWENGKK